MFFSAVGSYCIKDFAPPFCPTNSSSFGDPRCCIDKAVLGNNNNLQPPQPLPVV